MSIYYPILLSRENNITNEDKYIIIIVIGSIICSLCICLLCERINAIRQRQIEEPVIAPNNFTFV